MLYFITLKEIWKNLKKCRKGAFSRLVCPNMVRATASIFKKIFAFNSGNKTTDLKAEGINDKLLAVKPIAGCIEMLNINDKLFAVKPTAGCIELLKEPKLLCCQ